MRYDSWLIKQGLTNQHADYGDMVDESRPLVRKAYCSSQYCAKGGDKNHHMVLKPRVGEREWKCPDCKHVLFWETKRGKKH